MARLKVAVRRFCGRVQRQPTDWLL